MSRGEAGSDGASQEAGMSSDQIAPDAALIDERPDGQVAGGTGGGSGEEARLYGLLAELPNVDLLLAAAEEIRDAGYSRWDAHTPFPVHGLDGAMGIRSTKLPWLVFAGGLAGAVGGLILQWWTNAVDYPFVISGKPLFSVPANIPIAFETTILLAAFAALLGMLILNRLPQLYHPLFTSRRFRRVSDDKLFICIEAEDPRFDAVQTRQLLESVGAVHVEEVAEREHVFTAQAPGREQRED